MDKQDELAAVIESKLHDHGARFEYGDGLEIAAGDIAAAVRSFMGSPEVVERAAVEMASEVNFTFSGFDERTQSKYLRQARAALSAAIGEDIGGAAG